MVPAFIASWALGKNKSDAEHVTASVAVSSTAKPTKRKKKERVLSSKGGKQVMPAQPSPREQAEARDWEAQQAESRARLQREAEERRKADEDARALESWKGSVGNAVAGVQNYGQRKLQSYGMDSKDPYGIWDMFSTDLDTRRNSLADRQEFGSTINNSVFDNALAEARSKQRSEMSRKFGSAVNDEFFDTTFNDKVDDTYLDAILNEQYDDTVTQVTNARDRGQLNPFAYNKALEDLGKNKTTARGELETIGRGVLAGGRNSAATARDGVTSRINSFDFGDNINVDTEAQKVRGKATDFLGSLDSELRRTVGSRKFFDPNSIIAKSSAAAGVSNYTPNTGAGGNGTNALLGVFADQERNKQTQGAF